MKNFILLCDALFIITVLFGCAPMNSETTGDIAEYLNETFIDYGAVRLKEKNPKRIPATWKVAREKDTIIIQVFGPKYDEIDRHFRTIYRKDLITATTNLDGQLHAFIDTKIKGTGIQYIDNGAFVEIIAVKKK